MGGVRLITEPVVRLVGRPAVDWGEVAGYLADIGSDVSAGDFAGPAIAAGDGQVLIELGARTCYQSDPRTGRPHAAHVRHLQEVGHFSCDEHAQYSFLIAGISRSCSHELVRHRHLSPSQLSQRYCDQGDHNLGFVVPPALRPMLAAWEAGKPNLDALTGGELSAAATFGSWRRAVECAAHDYGALAARLTAAGLPRKQAREAARSVLPGCCETRLMLSGNLRAWREFAGKRCQPEADAEIRRLANRVFDLLSAEAPDVFADLRREPLGDGTFALGRGRVG